MKGVKAGFAMCGSFCTFAQVLPQMERLAKMGAEITPIMSQVAFSTDTRFGRAEEINGKIEETCGKKIIHTIAAAEPIGPKKLLDIMIVAPCTGNTAAKIALGITDTPVALAVKAHLRNARPVVLAMATNDALGASAKNIGLLMNTQNIFFVPMRQDDVKGKPNSLVADFSKLCETCACALNGEQFQPVYI